MRTTIVVALAAGAAAQPSTLAGTQRGMIVGTNYGLDDSDNACARGIVAACGLPNMANIFNPNPSMRYQTAASDLGASAAISTGRYSATGARVVTGNPLFDQNTLDVPFWTAGGAVNSGGVYTTGANDWSRTPIASQTNYVTGNPAAPNAFIPSASNALLPGSAAFGLANAAPWLTTAPNPLTSAGFGYSTAISGTSNLPLNGFSSSPAFGLGRPTAGFGAGFGTGFPSTLGGFPSAPFSGGFSAAPFSGFNSGFNGAPLGGFSGAPFNAGFNGGFASAPFGGFNSAPFTGGFNSAPFNGGFASAPFNGGFASAPFTGGFSSAPFSGGFPSAPFGTGFNGFPGAAPATLTAPATTGFMGTPLTTAPAFTNPWTQNSFGFAPAAGVAPSSF